VGWNARCNAIFSHKIAFQPDQQAEFFITGVSMRKRKSITDVVHPEILEAARTANQLSNEHAQALRNMGIKDKYWMGTRQDGEFVSVQAGGTISLETSTAMIELASIQHQFEKVNNGN